jgi:DNA-binding CsgD family transcriptional regulator
LTTALAAQGPLMLAVDDAHGGDTSSLRYLSYLGQRVTDVAVLLVMTVRTGEHQPEQLRALLTGASVERIAPRPLSGEASATLTRAALGPRAADEFCSACHAVTRGNPFLLKELLGQLGRDAVDPSAALAAQVARVTPETVRRTVLMRLAALSPACHELARAAVVLGDLAELREAAELAALETDEAARAADTLVAAEILAAETPLRFVHPLVREAIDAEIPSHQRSVSHGRAARLLGARDADPQRVAVQLLQSEPAGDQWVVDRLRLAAAGALSEGAQDPAAGFLRRALAEPPDETVRVAVLRELARAEGLAGSAAAIEHLEQALALAQAPRQYAEVGLELVFMLFRHGQMPAAVELSHRILESAPPEDPAFEYRLIGAAVCGAVLVRDLRPHIGALLERLPAELRGETPEERFVLSARLAAACASLAPMDEIADLGQRTLGGGKLLEDLLSEDLLYWNAASCLIVADRFDPAQEAIEIAFGDARRRGSIVGFALCSCFRSLLHYRTGNLTAGLADGRQALAATSPSETLIYGYAVAFLIDCLIERGELAEALQLATAPALSGELPDVFGLHLVRVARGRLRIALGDAQAGVEELLATGEALGPEFFGPAMCPWRARASTGLSVLGRDREAAELAEEELSLARRTRSAWGETVALQALATVNQQDAVELLGQAAEGAERAGLALERARALVMLGAVSRRRGRRRAAAELLREGLDAAAACGALAVEERARGELVAIGLNPRRRRTTGVDALTPAERRVAELAAGGMTNPEIAQALFVSLRTVETHLTHSYQKLGIGSRKELEPALAT